MESPNTEASEYHADQAEKLLAQLRDGTNNHGPYAAAAATKAQAATAHAMLALLFAGP